MPIRFLSHFVLTCLLLFASSSSVHATPICVAERAQRIPFKLTGDSVKWTMTIAPGADCIQGLRWSYMQISDVTVASEPSKGRLQIVGPGFRYTSAGDHQVADKFSLLITGKIRQIAGTSTLYVEINPQQP